MNPLESPEDISNRASHPEVWLEFPTASVSAFYDALISALSAKSHLEVLLKFRPPERSGLLTKNSDNLQIAQRRNKIP
jgi:hypothetical protein